MLFHFISFIGLVYRKNDRNTPTFNGKKHGFLKIFPKSIQCFFSIFFHHISCHGIFISLINVFIFHNYGYFNGMNRHSIHVPKFLKNPKSSAPCLQFLHELLRLLSLQATLIRLGLDRFSKHRKALRVFVKGPKKDI